MSEEENNCDDWEDNIDMMENCSYEIDFVFVWNYAAFGEVNVSGRGGHYSLNCFVYGICLFCYLYFNKDNR